MSSKSQESTNASFDSSTGHPAVHNSTEEINSSCNKPQHRENMLLSIPWENDSFPLHLESLPQVKLLKRGKGSKHLSKTYNASPLRNLWTPPSDSASSSDNISNGDQSIAQADKVGKGIYTIQEKKDETTDDENDFYSSTSSNGEQSGNITSGESNMKETLEQKKIRIGKMSFKVKNSDLNMFSCNNTDHDCIDKIDFTRFTKPITSQRQSSRTKTFFSSMKRTSEADSSYTADSMMAPRKAKGTSSLTSSVSSFKKIVSGIFSTSNKSKKNNGPAIVNAHQAVYSEKSSSNSSIPPLESTTQTSTTTESGISISNFCTPPSRDPANNCNISDCLNQADSPPQPLQQQLHHLIPSNGFFPFDDQCLLRSGPATPSSLPVDPFINTFNRPPLPVAAAANNIIVYYYTPDGHFFRQDNGRVVPTVFRCIPIPQKGEQIILCAPASTTNLQGFEQEQPQEAYAIASSDSDFSIPRDLPSKSASGSPIVEAVTDKDRQSSYTNYFHPHVDKMKSNLGQEKKKNNVFAKLLKSFKGSFVVK